MNKTILNGRLVKDVEFSYLQKVGTPKINFTLAVERSYQKDYNNKVVDYIPVEFIGKRAEKIATLISKGNRVLIQGELHINSYKKDDQYKSFTSVSANLIEIIDYTKHDEVPNFSEVDTDVPF